MAKHFKSPMYLPTAVQDLLAPVVPPAKYMCFQPFIDFADILAIRVVFTRTSCWFSQYPYPSPISICEFITTMIIIGEIHPRLILILLCVSTTT
jgi:hypothetical protein